jgi:hypothetical protein|tara:strand:+ start:435 stop:731 length:297 start_codon:yes stop_codon:yes gene_type:complete
MSNTTYKHRNCIIENISTDKFPNMVKVTKAPKLRSYFLERRYVTLEKCIVAIEGFESDRLINSKEQYVKAQLEDVVIISEAEERVQESEDFLTSGSEE